jgi:HEAT repeat protein
MKNKMKKIYPLLAAMLLCLATVYAQTPANRTANTIIADVLAQLPAQNEKQFNSLNKDLASTGETGVLQLVKMLNQENRAKAEYALSGLAHYVSAPNQESVRLPIVNAFLKSLDGIGDDQTKAFIISLIAVSGKDEAVGKLASYLDDPSLEISNPASKALVAINSSASQKALLDGLKTAKETQSKKNIIWALAKLQLPEAEEPLRALLNTQDHDLLSAVTYALGQTGSKVSVEDLKKTKDIDANLSLLERIISQGDAKLAEKEASEWIKKLEKLDGRRIAGRPEHRHHREHALQIQMKANPANVSKLLQSALNEKDKDFRNAALVSALDYTDANLVRFLTDNLKKANPEVKIDILNAFSKIYDCPIKKGFLESSFTDIFAGLLSDKDNEVKQATAEVLVKANDAKAIAALSKLLNSKDAGEVSLAKNTLTYIKGDIATAIVPYLATATNAGKITVLELLASRKSDKNVSAVFGQLESTDADVKKAAYTALKDVVTANDLPKLYALLITTSGETTVPVQQALISALNSLPKDKQFETISAQINKTDKTKQYLYYNVLAASETPEALAFIVDRYNKGTGNDQSAAFDALLNWKGIEAADELLTISKDAKASAYFDKAVGRYVRLIATSALSGENKRIFLQNALEVAKTDAQKNEILKQLGQTNSYLGLLLAGEYLDQKAVQQSAANTVMNIALNNKQFKGKNIKALLEKTAKVLDNPDANYQREAIKKHLDELPDEEGFVSIFNGKDLTGWKGLVENPLIRPKMKPEELAKKQKEADEIAKVQWTVNNDGILVFDAAGWQNLCTAKQYGDFEMYVDWKLEPSKDADAGIYLRGTPQVQIWNISRTDVGAQVGSGGLYNNQKNPSKPLKVADNKLGEWNNFYIKMVGDRVWVWFNGELVVDNIILENYWDRSLPIPPVEQIELQAHGSKVYYRNIYVKELERPKPFELSTEEKKEGYKILFDGTNMHEWTGNTVDYVLEDGCIWMHPSHSYGGNLYTKSEYGNFIYRFEFQLTPDANNGLGIRTAMEGDAAYVGMELQILDNEAPVYSDLAPYQYHGSVYGIIPAKRGYLKPTGEWNYQEVIANGDNIKITLNGTVILDGNIKEATKNGTPDHKEHPGLFNKKGHIGFLGHGSEVMFRNIRIKELK